MLTSISCDIFNKDNKTVTFRKGLNTVLGTNDGANSIGKSTMLMIIDFCFGGDDYIYRCKEVVDIMGDHLIKFCFTFNGKPYYFSRSTGTPEVVNLCDKEYNPMSSIPNTVFCEMIAKLYGIEKQTLRNAVGPFFRIYHRETLNESKPANGAFREPNADVIARLMKLFGKYDSIEASQKAYLEAKEKQGTLKKASDFKYVKKISAAQYERNKKRIAALKEEIASLLEDINSDRLSRDDIDRSRRVRLNNQRALLTMERDLYNVENIRLEGKRVPLASEKDFALLKQFFPDIDIERIERIESFHSQIFLILKGEYEDLVKKSEANVSRIDAELAKIEDEYKNLEQLTNVSDAQLDLHHKLTKELDELMSENAFYESTQSVDDDVKSLKGSLDSQVKSITEDIQSTINNAMKELNDEIYSGRKTCPRIRIDLLDRYFFSTPSDSGTGAQQRGVAIFDLVMLGKTKLPAFIHDSVMLKHIEDDTLAKLFEYYEASPKQVFIAFDRATTYPNSVSLLTKSCVVELGRGEHALFGRDFNEAK